MGALTHWSPWMFSRSSCGAFAPRWESDRDRGRITCRKCRAHKLKWRRVERQIDLELRAEVGPRKPLVGDDYGGTGIGLRTSPEMEKVAEAARQRSRAYHQQRRSLRWAR